MQEASMKQGDTANYADATSKLEDKRHYSTQGSRAITQRVLIEPNPSLTSLIGREGVCSGWYGRSMPNQLFSTRRTTPGTRLALCEKQSSRPEAVVHTTAPRQDI